MTTRAHRQSLFRTAMTFAVVALAVACTPVEDRYSADGDGCVAGGARSLGAVDWSKAHPRALTIDLGEYRPMILHLTRGKPYLLRIANDDDESRVFRAPLLFANAVVDTVTVDGSPLHYQIDNGLWLVAGAAAEVRFAATCAGRYPFSDSAVPGVEWGHAGGMIYVE